MAHQTPNHATIDQIASQPATQEETQAASEAETTLAYGAEGICLNKLIGLLALLGYATNDVFKGTSSKLDETVLVDLRAAQADLGVSTNSELLEPADIPVGVKGELVDTPTWNALYQAAIAKIPTGPTSADTAA